MSSENNKKKVINKKKDPNIKKKSNQTKKTNNSTKRKSNNTNSQKKKQEKQVNTNTKNTENKKNQEAKVTKENNLKEKEIKNQEQKEIEEIKKDIVTLKNEQSQKKKRKKRKKKKNTNTQAKQEVKVTKEKKLDKKEIKKNINIDEFKDIQKNKIKKQVHQKNNDNKENINLNKEDKKQLNNHKKKYKSIIAITILGLILIISIIIFIMAFFINKNIDISLIGNTTETIEVFSEYNDPGYNATLFKMNINKYIKITNNLNNNKLGTYTITYKLPFINTHKITRTINVIDTTKPTITLNGDETITMYVDDEYTEKGVTIEDNYDEYLYDSLIIESNLDINTAGTYTITYKVKDSSNNESSIKRTVKVKNKPTYTKTCNTTNPISNYICENNYKVSVGYYNLTTNQTYYYNKYEQYYGASLIKTLDALYLYDKNMINDELKSHVKKIITVSDNPSHQYLVNYIGKNNLKSYGNSLGATYTLIGGDNFGITTVSDQIVYMKKLYNMTKDNQNEELKSFFINSYYNNLLFEGSPTIMHKYGWWEQVFHNSGIVLDENPYIVTILTKEGYNDYNKIICTISKLVYDYHKAL